MRKTLRELSRLVAAKRAITPGFQAVLSMTAIGTDKALRFVASVDTGDGVYEVASDSGKIKTFTDVDGFLKFAAKAAESSNGVYSVSVDTGALLASVPPSDVKAWAGNQVIRLGRVKIAQTEVIAAIDADLGFMAGWESGNAAQQAKLAEVQAQRAAVVTDIAAIDSEVVRLTAIANS
jgi:hypothetical protein